MHKDLPPCQECPNQKGLFCNLVRRDKEELSENKGGQVYQKGAIIFKNGHQPHGLFCIFKGKVKLSKIGKDGREQIVRLAGPGDVLGYRALLSESPYSATATALEDSAICHFPRAEFMEKLQSNSRLSFNVIQMLSNQLKDSENKMVSIAHNSMEERVAQAILLVKLRFGLEEDNATLPVVLSRKEIGEIAAITTESVIRTLSQLQKNKVLALEKKRIKILDMPALTRIARVEVA